MTTTPTKAPSYCVRLPHRDHATNAVPLTLASDTCRYCGELGYFAWTPSQMWQPLPHYLDVMTTRAYHQGRTTNRLFIMVLVLVMAIVFYYLFVRQQQQIHPFPGSTPTSWAMMVGAEPVGFVRHLLTHYTMETGEPCIPTSTPITFRWFTKTEYAVDPEAIRQYHVLHTLLVHYPFRHTTNETARLICVHHLVDAVGLSPDAHPLLPYCVMETMDYQLVITGYHVITVQDPSQRRFVHETRRVPCSTLPKQIYARYAQVRVESHHDPQTYYQLSGQPAYLVQLMQDEFEQLGFISSRL